MAKQLNTVNLSFVADTRQAKAQLQDLQKELYKLTQTPSGKLGLEKDINDAIKAAAELHSHLEKATNIDTGNLDFSRLNKSIKESGTTLSAYGKQLQSLGPQGQQAFLMLAKSVASAEIPIKRTNKLLQEFGVSLANTARWQFSSSMLHGFMGAVQSAYGYAQDLNESLNNIRIVTGRSTEEMARFAQEANKAAKALSASTTQYTNASLIYYQQGLSDQQVKERTDITIKMANVAKQSAEVVSDQMTSVWNNFYNGSKSLEYYADVMTALGAATASSTDEIAGGLEKFAAIADTIGLSYEYAAAALATITSNTRQSEEVVGTALKTIFARLQGLKLGETLEDGTDLNKYSEALQKVGVDVLDATGELRRADDILTDMASKWETLSKAEQVALAQAVGGVRQYNQIVALMDEWDTGDSDSMKANLATAYGSTGALQEQADIYAESWEAAQDRVKAAAESIYDALLNDEFFIKVLNKVEKIINCVDYLIDSLGGLKGTLAAVGAIVTKLFSNQLSQGITNMAYNIKMMTKAGRAAEAKERKNFIEEAKNSIPKSNEFTTKTEEAQQNSMESQLTLQSELLANSERMSEQELQRNKMLLDRNRLMQEAIVLATKEKEATDESVDNNKFKLQTRIANGIKDPAKQREANLALNQQINKIRASSEASLDIHNLFKEFKNGADHSAEGVEKLKKAILSLDVADEEVKALIKAFGDVDFKADEAEQEVSELIARIRALGTKGKEEIKKLIPESDGEEKEIAAEVDALVGSIDSQTAAERKRKNAVDEGAKSHKIAKKAIEDSRGSQKQWSDIIVESANMAFSAASAITMLGNAFETLQDPNLSGWEKFTTILTTLGMLVPTLISIFSTLKTLISGETVVKLANVAATIAQVAAERALNKEKGETQKTTRRGIKDTIQDTKEKIAALKKKTTDAAWDSLGEDGQKKYIEKYLGKQGYKKAGTKNDGNILWQKGGQTNTAANFAKKDSSILDGAKKMFGKSGSGGSFSLGGMAASVGLIVAGVAVIGGAIKLAVDQATKAEKAVERAKESVQQLNNNFSTVQATFDDFSNKVSNFQNADSALDGLTKGTEEYKQAVYEANQAAMELLATNENLKYTIQDGQIVFDDGELDKAMAAQRDKLILAQTAKLAGQNNLIRAEQDLSVRDMSRDLTSSADRDQKMKNLAAATGAGTLGGAGIGAGVGGIAGAGVFSWATAGIGALIGAIVGAITGLTTGLIANAKVGSAVEVESQALKTLSQAYMRDSSIMAKTDDELKDYLSRAIDEGGLEIQDSTLVDSLVDNRDSVIKLMDEMTRNTMAINRNNDLIAAQLLSNNPFVSGSEYEDEVIDKTGDVYGIAYDKALNSELVQNWGKEGISKATGVNDEANRVWQEYLKYGGLDPKKHTLVDTTGTDENRMFVYLDEQGNRHEVALKTMQETYAHWIAATNSSAQASELLIDFLKYEKDPNPANQAFASFVSTDTFENATYEDFNAMQAEVQDHISEGGTYESYLESKLGDLTAAAERYGYNSADELVTAFTTALSSGYKFWKEIDFEAPIKDDLTIDVAKQLQDIVTMLEAGGLGDTVGGIFLDGLEAMINTVPEENRAEALNRLMAIDWSQIDSAYQAKAIIEELGGTVQMTDEDFEAWNETMNRANYAMFNYKELCDNLEKIANITKDLSMGKILTDEDYDLLVKYNEELSKYFLTLGDGSHMLIGDLLDVTQEIESTAQEERKKALRETTFNAEIADQRRATDQNVKDSGLSREALGTSAYTVVGTEEVTTQNDVNFGHQILGVLAAMGSAETGYHISVEDAAKEFAGTTTTTQNVYGVDENVYRRQLEFLEKQGYAIDQYTEATEANATAVAGLVQKELDRLPSISDEEYNQAKGDILASEFDYAMNAKNAEERQAMYENGEISHEAYAKAAEVAHNTEKWEGMDPKEVEEYADALMDVADSSEMIADNMTEEAAEDVALYVKRMNKGIDTLSKNFKDWNSVLSNSDESSEEYAEAMGEMKEALSDVLGVSKDFVRSDFVAQHLEDIEKAANGDADAINRLKVAMSEDIICQIVGVSKFEDVNADIASLHQSILDQDLSIDVGATLATGDFTTAANALIKEAGMTVDEAQAYFNSLGYEPTFKTEPQPVTTTTYPTRTHTDYAITKGSINILGTEWPIPTVDRIETVTQGAPVKTTSWMDVPVLSADGSPEIESITKVSNGGMNNMSSSNPGGPPKGGGGGGGSKATLKSDNDKDRYHTIKNQLEDLTRSYENVSKAAERAFGAEKLSLIDDQIDKTDDLIKKQEEYIGSIDDLNLETDNWQDTIAGNLAMDKTLMEDAWSAVMGDSGVSLDYDTKDGATGFDAYGNIENYSAVEKAMHEKYNQMANDYNSGKITEEAWQEFEEQYKDLEKTIEQYEETYDTFYDERQKLQELENQKIDLRLSKVQYKIELQVNIAEDDLALIDQALSRIEEKAFASAERINLQTQKIGNLYEQISIRSKALQESLSASGISQNTIDQFLATGDTALFKDATLTAEQINAIREHRDSLLDLNNQLLEVKNSIQEEFVTAFDEHTEAIERGQAAIEHYTSVLDSYRNIVDIVGKDVLGVSDELMAQMTATTVENAIDAVEANKAHLDTLVKQRDEAFNKMHDKSLSEEDRAFWKDQYNTLNEAAQQAQQELLASWETSLEAIVTQFEEAVESAVDTFGKAFYDGGLDKLSDDFSFAQEQDDMYIEDYQKIYELSKLTRDINKSMDDTKTIAGKQKLKTLMEDINKLQEEGVEMSEYDLEYLQAEYDLRLAEIALEEAQRAKDTVRLSRDSEGNFSYVYTQNSDAVDEAQQKYEDALYSMQDLSSNYIDEMSAKLIETSQAMQEELASLRIQDYASIDDYYAAVAEVEAKYQKQLSSQEAELNKAIGNNKELYDQDWQNYAAATGYKISATEDFVTAWGDTSLAQMMGLEDGTSFSDIMAGATDGLVQGLLAAAETYYQNIDKANSAAGTHTGQFAAMLESEIKSIETESDKAAKAVSKMAEDMDKALDDVMKKITDWQTTHGKTIDAIIEANTKGIESFNTLIDYLSGNVDATVDYSINGKVTTADGDTITGTPISLDGAATGGYTGEWGNYGKLAWIHQKELILNENDTANMLKLVEMTRQMISVIDTKAQQLSQGLGTPISATFTDNENDVLEQYVEIKADFPNVNNHTEIEEALNNLINTASQYAHRRKP